MAHALRSQDCREDAGLPQHPANAWINCPVCDGTGETDVVWYCEDAYTCNVCTRCSGNGELLDGHEDPLLALQRTRQRRNWAGKHAAHHYELARLVAMRPQCGLSMADMRAMATRCVTRTHEAVSRMAA